MSNVMIEDTDTREETGAGCAIYLVVRPLTLILNAWVLSLTWLWFVTPTIGLRALSVAEAFGISLVVQYLTYQHQYGQSMKWSNAFVKESILIGAFVPLWTLTLGWLVKTFVMGQS